MSKSKRNKLNPGDAAFDYKSIFGETDAAARAIISGDAILDLIARARVRGVVTEPPALVRISRILLGYSIAPGAQKSKEPDSVN